MTLLNRVGRAAGSTVEQGHLDDAEGPLYAWLEERLG